MTTYTYDPNTDEYVGPGGVVGVDQIGASDSVVFGDPTPGLPQLPYTVTLPSNFHVNSISIKSGLATVVVPAGGTLLAGQIRLEKGNLNVGTSASNALTTLTGSITLYKGSNVNVTGNVDITSLIVPFSDNRDRFVAITVTAGANLTMDRPLHSSYGRGQIALGTGSTLTMSSEVNSVSAQEMISAAVGTGVLRFSSIKNNGQTTDFTGPSQVTYEATSITGGTIKGTANTKLAATTLTNVNIVGDLSLQSFSTGLPSCTFEDPTGIGICSVPGGLTLGGTCDPLSFNVVGGSITGESFNPLTFSPGTVINVTVNAQSFGGMTFFSETTLQGRLHLSGTGNYKITEYAPPLTFAAGSSVQIDKGAALEINAAQTNSLGFDNEATIQLAGGTLQLDQTPTTLGVIQFYTGNSTLKLGNSSLATTFATSGTLSDFSDTDAVIFNGATFGANAAATLAGNVLSVTDQNGTSYGAFTLSRDDALTYGQNEFVLTAVTGGMKLSTSGVAVLAAPVVTGDTKFTVHNYFAPGPAVVADFNVAVSDAGSTTLAGATVAITSNFVVGDVLGFTAQNGIAGNYNAAAGVLSLNGTASVADYQQALDSVTYGFTPGGDPTLGGGVAERILSWTVTDGTITSLPATTTITEKFTRPTLTFGGNAAYDTHGTPVVISPLVSLTDPNTTTLISASIAILGGFTGDLLTVSTAGTSISTSYDGTAQVLMLSGADTVAHYVSVFDSVAFSSTLDDPTSGGTAPVRGFAISATDSGGNVATDQTAMTVSCFAGGTIIATAIGEVTVEALRAGDLVRTRDGTLVPVVWTGRRRIDCLRHPNPASVHPVCVRSHAFGPDLPRRDLLLSPDHAVFLDGVFIPVKYLVDGEAGESGEHFML